MVDNILSKSGGLLKTTGWGAVAAALAMMALPSATLAQDRGGGRSWGGGQSAQAQQSPGGNSGRSWGGNRGGGDGGQRAVRSGGQDRGNWNRAQATPNRQVTPNRQITPRQTVRPDLNQGQQRNWNRGDTSNGAAWRASQGQRLRQQQDQRDQARTVERQRQTVERQRQAAEWQRQNQARDAQWSNRNRTYSDPNRNRSYRDGRDDIRRDNVQRENWQRNNDRWTGNNRWNNDNRWNNGNRWNDSRRRNDSYRWSNSGRWDRDWRRDNRYDWYGYRNTNRSAFRMGRYYAPYQNYYYRPVGIGFRLDTLFFGNRYWLDDPGYYRLPPAYGPYRWIRYYDDALLVDIHSGEVIDVINNFFW